MEKRIIVGVIPARYQSTRFPGKPLTNILGKPMIQWVYERACAVDEIRDVYVATDDTRIYEAVKSFGGKVIMTGLCACGTERVYEAVRNIDYDIVLNIQGDEPLIRCEMIRELIAAFEDASVAMATLKKQIYDEKIITDPNVVKVITDLHENAIYFSRSKIPYSCAGDSMLPYYKHIGIYGYTKQFLSEFVSWPQTPLELSERLEQLRAIEHGCCIRVVQTEFDSAGVDLPEHIAQVEAQLKKEDAG